VIPVIDVRTRFGITPDPSNERFNKLIIVSVQGRIVGLKVCRIYGELRVPFSALRPAPSVLRAPSGASEFFAGVCRTDDELAFVINLEALLDPSNASLLAPINQAAHEDAAEQS
jgi:purine-binding chemotaxis protein CheW